MFTLIVLGSLVLAATIWTATVVHLDGYRPIPTQRRLQP